MFRCSAVVVTYNSAQSIVPCLEALTREDCEIVVIDNASVDDTVQRVRPYAAAGRASLLLQPRNLGFGPAANAGASRANGRGRGDVVLILNPDAIAEPGSVAHLLHCLDETGAAAVGGSLLEADDKPQRGFAFRKLPTLASLLCETLLINQLWPANPVNRHYRCLDADYSHQQEVEQPAGACLAIRREVWDGIGGFDERFYPVWFEDVDLCKRIRDRGMKIVYCPTARFRHSGSHSVGRLSFQQKQRFWYRNMLAYAEKHFAPAQPFLLRMGILAGMVLRSGAALLGIRPVSLPEALRAYRQVIGIACSRPAVLRSGAIEGGHKISGN